MRCPDCARETVYVPTTDRPGTSGKDRQDRKSGVLNAVTRDGTCCTCHRARKGTMKDGRRYTGHGRFLKGNMTDAEVEAARARLTIMELDRRARGIPEEGIPTEQWAHGNGGLYSWEVK